MSTSRSLLLLLIIILITSGCRIRVPTPEEQSILVQRGAFPNGPPAWILRGDSAGGSASSGLIPETFSSGRATRSAQSSARRAGALSVYETTANKQRASNTQASSDDSPLDRIASLCPGLESSVAEALTTIDKTERIQKYSQLTLKCSRSYDLWLWLARDYYSSNQLAKAVRCLNEVLILDSSNEEARALLSASKKQAE